MRGKKLHKKAKRDRKKIIESQAAKKGVAMSTDEQFQLACSEIRRFSKKPPDLDMLEIYGLYKQATVGDINTPKSSATTGDSKLKWDAWNGRKGVDSNTAKEQYVTRVKILANTFK